MIHFCDVRLTTTYELSSLEVCTSVPTTIQKALAQNRKRHLALASVQKEGESTALPAREKQNNGRQWKDHDEILGGCALHGDKRRFQRWSMFPSSSRGTTPSSETWRERRFDNCHCGIRDTAEFSAIFPKCCMGSSSSIRWWLQEYDMPALSSVWLIERGCRYSSKCAAHLVLGGPRIKSEWSIAEKSNRVTDSGKLYFEEEHKNGPLQYMNRTALSNTLFFIHFLWSAEEKHIKIDIYVAWVAKTKIFSTIRIKHNTY